jgi:asparagine synthase (glutamine-hydrolysing)
MCGIYGQFNFRDNTPLVEQDIRRATDTIAHRGPDDEGFYVSGPIGLGFRRLSIIDLAGGHQPMSDQDRRVWVIFNGEIYNFADVRSHLEKRGHVFQTRSDTEVLVHGYKEWGEALFDRLNGMFGLAIWDETERKLVVARDAMGIKPVYYRLEGGTLVFASEIRALTHRDSRIDIDPVSLNLFLRYRYTPSPLTLFESVRKLAPGTMLVVHHGQIQVKRWYQFKPTPFEKEKSLDEAKEELLDLYKAALKRHLISDVPLGLLLSGGLDSGLLLALMNLYGESWRTYTVGYGKSFQADELDEGARTAALFGARHVSVELTRELFETYLPKVVACLEEPVAASSIVPMYFVCERARQDVKVVLIGQGPDELFGGYTRHLGVHYGNIWRRAPRVVRSLMASSMNMLPRSATLKRGVYSLDVPERFRRFQNVFSILPGTAIDALFVDGILEPNAGDRILDCWSELEPLANATDELGAFQFLELRSSLPDELLIYADKLSMAHGLEGRVPYLDREVVEYAQRLTADLKIRYGSRKYLHRKVCAAFLPSKVMRRPKRGFASTVVDGWFKRALDSRMNDLLLDEVSMMYRFLKPAAVRALLRAHKEGASDNHKILFSLIVFEQWLRSAVDNCHEPAVCC